MPYIKYDYDSARDFCTELGMTFLEEWVPAIDQSFRKLELTQAQVDQLMREYIWRVHYLFDPKTYSWRARILLALHFLFGKSLKG